MVWKPTRKQAHMQLVREQSATVISAHWATVDWSWPKKWNQCTRPKLRFKNKIKKGAGGEWIVKQSPKNFARKEKPPSPPHPHLYLKPLPFWVHVVALQHLVLFLLFCFLLALCYVVHCKFLSAFWWGGALKKKKITLFYYYFYYSFGQKLHKQQELWPLC